ncbi:MAG: transglutaminaseTgpA domain-containing protein [Flavonifractor plautii]
MLSLAILWTPTSAPHWADRALQHLTNQAVRLGDGLLEGSGPFGIGSGGGRLADADGSVSLSDAGPLRFSGRTVLEVETDLTGRIYLRGLSDAVYDGESWQPLDEAAYNWQARLRGVTYGAPVTLDMDLGVTGAESLFAQFQPMNFPALAVRDAHPESPYARITVRNVGADPGYVYVPYHILTQPGELSGAEFVHDAYLARAARVWTHTIYVQPDASPAASAGLRGSCHWRRRPTRTSCGGVLSPGAPLLGKPGAPPGAGRRVGAAGRLAAAGPVRLPRRCEAAL